MRRDEPGSVLEYFAPERRGPLSWRGNAGLIFIFVAYALLNYFTARVWPETAILLLLFVLAGPLLCIIVAVGVQFLGVEPRPYHPAVLTCFVLAILAAMAANLYYIAWIWAV
jgi:hypothetical protein